MLYNSMGVLSEMHVLNLKKNLQWLSLWLYKCTLFLQVYQLLTDLKEKRKEMVKNKHSAGQQNLNTIMYEVPGFDVIRRIS